MYFSVYGAGLGACGKISSDDSMIAAASHILFDSFPGATTDDPNHNPICGRKVKATYKDTTVEVEIVDKCEACDYNDLDFSTAAFQKFGPMEEGRLHGMVVSTTPFGGI
ncbi:RlpA-like double-psi beta-barrel-protein domain-containing protein-containing protein [Phakopsora pachyrhizi]|uniref:RlpA-like double-psi beta-barrel-protein domain-containing protein-containing protein n=1 Tax=Phakopsora pachyrhizi TaxID=170000 RepID=A0AAV0B2Y4_PHAPC|nr:RlpA-like double-psi beta-barrel-protein domain-containing protein-containing protein [Phakopsora pachyrhizi]CAH7683400.1 RlpA-like double-psi beta-barrel-protein domain-containing protein-containing protein [Phakopsora pachyrhizi]